MKTLWHKQISSALEILSKYCAARIGAISVKPIAPLKHSPLPTVNAWLYLCMGLTQESEGCLLDAYPDPASGGAPWTCGWGITGEDVSADTVWTQAYADSRLADELQACGDCVDGLVKVSLSSGQKAALADFVFNLGAANLATSTLLKKLNQADYSGAAEEFLRWDKAADAVMPGLTIRRARERTLFLTGQA